MRQRPKQEHTSSGLMVVKIEKRETKSSRSVIISCEKNNHSDWKTVDARCCDATHIFIELPMQHRDDNEFILVKPMGFVKRYMQLCLSVWQNVNHLRSWFIYEVYELRSGKKRVAYSDFTCFCFFAIAAFLLSRNFFSSSCR